MAARSALQSSLEDTSRAEEKVFADALAIAKEKKLATDDIARISEDLFRDAEHQPGTTLTEKPVFVSAELAVRSLVQLSIAPPPQKKESLRPLGEEPRPPSMTPFGSARDVSKFESSKSAGFTRVQDVLQDVSVATEKPSKKNFLTKTPLPK